jgi:hypothetical protein
MRLTILAFALLPAVAQAQNTTVVAPDTSVAQSCPVGMSWDADAQSCGLASEGTTPIDGLPGGASCHTGTAREVMS